MDLCVYHSADMDGWCSGALVNYYKNSSGEYIKFKGYSHSLNFNIKDLINKYKDCTTIYIVDYSFKLKDLQELLKAGFTVIWIDHHKTAIQEYAKSGFFTVKKYEEHILNLSLPGAKFYGFVSDKYSGAKITYKVLFNNIISHNKNLISNIVDLVSIYDTWDIKNPLWKNARAFNEGCQMYNLMPWVDEWKELLTDENIFNGICEEGKVISDYQNSVYERDMKNYAGELQFEGLNWVAINDVGNSLKADTIFDPKCHDAILYYRWKPKEKAWKLSFFNASSKQIGKMNEIAQKYGGGGHEGAAGAVVKELPFNLSDIEPIEEIPF